MTLNTFGFSLEAGIMINPLLDAQKRSVQGHIYRYRVGRNIHTHAPIVKIFYMVSLLAVCRSLIPVDAVSSIGDADDNDFEVSGWVVSERSTND
jgi:hypothetical protein